MLISVCIATYNGEKYIAEQLSSILPQLSTNDEIIISDDGSTDRTLDIISEFNDSRIKVLNNNRLNSEFRNYYKVLYNVGRNFENALKSANGDYIFLADQDDIWSKDKVDLMSIALKNNELVVCNCIIINDNREVIQDSYFKLIEPKAGIFRTIIRSSYHGCCLAFRKEVLHYALPLPNAPIGHDVWIGLMANYFGRVSFIDKPLVYYRQHSNNVSYGSTKSLNPFSFKINYRLILAFAFLKFVIRRLIYA